MYIFISNINGWSRSRRGGRGCAFDGVVVEEGVRVVFGVREVPVERRLWKEERG